jgi:hypothetical protein
MKSSNSMAENARKSSKVEENLVYVHADITFIKKRPPKNSKIEENQAKLRSLKPSIGIIPDQH